MKNVIKSMGNSTTAFKQKNAFNNPEPLIKNVMKQPGTLYHLYCLNMQCEVSIYNHMVDLLLPLTAGNLISAHACAYCSVPLVSTIDIEIKRVMAQMNSQNVKEVNYLNN